MPLKDTTAGYGAITRWLHWLMALAMVALFALGLWMVELTYYDPWYNRAPDLHKSIGMVFFAALLARVMWRAINQKPEPESHSAFERRTATLVHWSLYALLFGLCITGYLIATAKGQPIVVFSGLEVPAVWKQDGLETPAGVVHDWLAWITIALASLHAGAAFKHHFWDRSRTLVRMWRG
ncbi:MAG: cytochrome b [Hyphomicrobiaceae bacterium]|nr:cytochrome b [Hyphomicrobiaceae bacterium]MCC0009395.1 cytochrome b [Hyphomicrobiaceae bacterium]